MAKPKEMKKASENQKVYSKRFAKNANYDAIQDEPLVRMGQESFANLPDKPMFLKYKAPRYRDGIINDFDSGVEVISGIGDNYRKMKQDY